MSEASAALPDDVETLKRLVLGRDETIAKLLAEIARLKREVAKLKAERDILKKAAAYFAKESM